MIAVIIIIMMAGVILLIVSSREKGNLVGCIIGGVLTFFPTFTLIEEVHTHVETLVENNITVNEGNFILYEIYKDIKVKNYRDTLSKD